jgi:FkbH-like protein
VMQRAMAAETPSELGAGSMEILEAVRREPTYTNHCRAFEQLRTRSDGAPQTRTRVAVLSNFTVEPVVTCLTVQAALNALPVALYVAPYNEHAQEILQPKRELHRFKADIVLLLLTPEAVVPGVIAEPWRDSATRRQWIGQGITDLTGLLAALRARSSATILVANFVAHEVSPLGVLDWQEPMGIERALQQLNHGLAEWAHMQERIYVFDLAGLCDAFGRERAFDPRLRLLADQPFATTFLPRLGAAAVRYLRGAVSPARKCLVLDLDNTLWGGILGEDGAARLRLGGDAAGEGYRELQRAILALHSRGILLALCSRNDEAEAMAVLRDHPGMVLRPEHFAAVRVNWQDKVGNIESLAAELNIGLDSLVFIDDDPFERQSVRQRLPDVLVMDLPPDPALYRSALLQLTAFDTLHVTGEDRARSRMYQDRRTHERLRTEASSLEEYLTGLEMRITAVPAEGATRTRLFQLVQKTNQFNLTTCRYSEAEFDVRTRSPEWRVFGVHVRDRLGDSGVVGVVVLRLAAGVCDIETFLLSCRVLGRSIESAVLAHVADLARRAGAVRLRGRYIATPKNGLVRDVYEQHGFARADRDGEAEVWEADLAGFEVKTPAWARVQAPPMEWQNDEAAVRAGR